MARNHYSSIEPGQRFEQKGGFTWQVVRLIQFSQDLAPHVQLRNVREPTTTKTLSAEVLFDRARFRPLGSAEDLERAGA